MELHYKHPIGERTKRIIGLVTTTDVNLSAIADEVGVTRRRVEQIVAKHNPVRSIPPSRKRKR